MQWYKTCHICTTGPDPLTTSKVSEQTTSGEEKECLRDQDKRYTKERQRRVDADMGIK